MKPLKVYGWTGRRIECPPAPNGDRSTREIVAAPSAAAAARAAGATRPAALFCFTETGNAQEIALASANPGVVYWRKLDDWRGPYKKAG